MNACISMASLSLQNLAYLGQVYSLAAKMPSFDISISSPISAQAYYIITAMSLKMRSTTMDAVQYALQLLIRPRGLLQGHSLQSGV